MELENKKAAGMNPPNIKRGEEKMARNRYVLSCALRHIYLNDFGLDRIFIMTDLAALVMFYGDAQTPREIITEYTKLHTWLTRVELVRKIKGDDYVIPEARLCGIMDELKQIDIAMLMAFVRDKAVAAGDLKLTDIEGDTQWQ